MVRFFFYQVKGKSENFVYIREVWKGLEKSEKLQETKNKWQCKSSINMLIVPKRKGKILLVQN